MIAETIHADTGGGVVKERVVKNAMIYMAAQLLSWAVAILSVSLIPRRLGEVGTGQMNVAGQAVMTVAPLLTLSVDQYLNVEVGRDPSQAERLLRATIGLRLVCIPLMAVGACIALYVLKADRIIWTLGGICIVAQALGYVYGPMRSILAGWEDARRVATFDLMQAALPLSGVPFLGPGQGPIPFTIAGLVVGAFTVQYPMLAVRRRVGSLRPVFDVALWRKLIRSSLGFLVNEWVAPFMGFTTIYMLKEYSGVADVGVYSQAQRLVGTFMFVPTAIGAALLPALSRLADTDAEEFDRLQQRILVVLIVMGMPIVLLALMLADPFCHLLYGKAQFQTLPLVIKFCGLSVIPLYVTTILYRFLVAKRKNAIWGLFMLCAVILNLALCRVLIPWAQNAPGIHSAPVGATLAFTIAETFSMIMSFALLKVNPLNRETLGRIARALIAAGAMAGVMWAARGLFFPITGALGVGVFGWLAWKMQTLGRDDQQKLGELVSRKFGPLARRLRGLFKRGK